MQNELGKIVEYDFPVSICYRKLTFALRSLVTPMFADSHPRVRYAACQCVYVHLVYHGSLFHFAGLGASFALILRYVC